VKRLILRKNKESENWENGYFENISKKQLFYIGQCGYAFTKLSS